MWKTILGVLGTILGTPVVIVVVAHLWVKFFPFDSKGGRYQKGGKIHPLLTLICEVDSFCDYFFKFRLLSIDQKGLVKRALKLKYDPVLFGSSKSPNGDRDDDFLELLTTACEGLQKNPEITFTGRYLLNQCLHSLITSREKIINYAIEHREEVLKSEITKPIIITGIGRAGSTLLQNLLAQDPSSRGCKHWEVVWFGSPVPPATKEQLEANPPTHRKFGQVTKAYELLKKSCPDFVREFEKSHPIQPLQYDEELPVLMQAMLLQLWLPLAGPKYFEVFHKLEGKESAYLYLKRWLQVMQTACPPESHWVLKAPIHMVFLPVLLKVFPDARVIMCHRKMDVLIPSGTSFFESFNVSYMKDGYDRYGFADKICQHGAQMRNHMMEFRKTYEHPEQFVDVQYNDIVEDPISIVRNIYHQFNMPYTMEFEDRMKRWIEDNRQGKHGRHEYSLEMYNMEPDEVMKEWKDYTQTYLEKNENMANRKHDSDDSLMF